MSRIIGTITLPLVNTTTERFAHAIGEYAKLFIERGFEVEYDNRDNAECDSVSSQANPFEGRIQNYKIYTKADRTAESTQMRLISPCRRWYLIIHTNGRAEQTFQQISFLVMVPNGTGGITSIHPGMLHGCPTVKPIYPNDNMYSFTYEILENKSSYGCIIMKNCEQPVFHIQLKENC